MPTIGPFHATFQWNFSDTNAAPVHVGAGGYPLWQAAVVHASLFGVIGAWLDARWALLKWHWNLARRVHRLSKESRALVVLTVQHLESPIYPKAQAAVRKTATTLGFNTDDAIGRDLKRYAMNEPGRRENVNRHLHAMKTLKETAGSTMTNPQANFLTELAYQGFTISRK